MRYSTHSACRPLSLFALAGAALILLTLLGAVFGAARAAADDCNHTIFDGGGYIYDLEASFKNPAGVPPSVEDEYGEPSNGGSNGPAESPPGPVKTEDAWDDWGDVYVFNPLANILVPTAADKYDGPELGCTLAAGGQEQLYPVSLMQGLQVQHRWLIGTGGLNGARILTTLRNPASSPIAVTVVQGDPSGFDNLGSDGGTASRATSNGSNVFSSASFWGITSDSPTTDGDPALAHVWDGPGGALRASEVVLGQGSADTLYWAWRNVTVAPGATVAFISYEIQQAAAGRSTAAEVLAAIGQAQARQTQPASTLYAAMAPAEIAGTLNWAHPQPTAVIAPVAKANAAKAVTLSGAGSVAASGLPQCSVAAYAWKSGSKVGTGPTFTQLFSAGTQKVSLTVTSNCGASNTAEISFKVAKGFSFGKVKKNRKAGTAKLTLNVLGPATLTLKGKGVKKKVKKVKKAGKATLTVKATGKALKKLTATGQAKVKVTVAMTPTGGTTEKQTKKVNLKLG